MLSEDTLRRARDSIERMCMIKHPVVETGEGMACTSKINNHQSTFINQTWCDAARPWSLALADTIRRRVAAASGF